MESEQLGPINEALRILDQDILAVLEGAHNHRTCVSKADLENRIAVLAPPFLTHGCMVISELGQMSGYRKCSWDLGDAPYIGDVSASECLSGSALFAISSLYTLPYK